jgi:hypothetical protein
MDEMDLDRSNDFSSEDSGCDESGSNDGTKFIEQLKKNYIIKKKLNLFFFFSEIEDPVDFTYLESMDVIAIKDNKNLHDVNFNEDGACVIIKIGTTAESAELPILFYNKVDNKCLGKIGVAI